MQTLFEFNCPLIFSDAQVYTCESEPEKYVRSHSPIWYDKEALQTLRENLKFNRLLSTKRW